jgi:hypothetical protein
VLGQRGEDDLTDRDGSDAGAVLRWRHDVRAARPRLYLALDPHRAA